VQIRDVVLVLEEELEEVDGLGGVPGILEERIGKIDPGSWSARMPDLAAFEGWLSTTSTVMWPLM
jgi:hypothetical protein